MDEKILDDEEAELFGLKRKILPEEEGDADAREDFTETVEVKGMDAAENPSESDEEELPLDELEAKLDEGYTLDGYIDEDAVPLDFSDADADDESLVMLSPEEAAETVRRREEKARQDKELFEKLVHTGQAALDEGDYEKARESFTQANEFNSDDLEMNVGYMRAYSEDFTALDDPDMLAEVYEQCHNSGKKPFVERIRALFGDRIKTEAAAAEKRAEELRAEHEAETEERGKEISSRLSAATGTLLKLGLPFAVCAIAAILFAAFINAVEGSLFVILTAVFGGLGVILLVPTLFALRKTVAVNRSLRENERPDSTEAGQKSLEAEKCARFLRDCLKEDEESENDAEEDEGLENGAKE